MASDDRAAMIEALAKNAHRRYDQEFDAPHLSWRDFTGSATEDLDAMISAGWVRGPAEPDGAALIRRTAASPTPERCGPWPTRSREVAVVDADWAVRMQLSAHAENERFASEVFAAVRAVLDIHAPYVRYPHTQPENIRCSGCSFPNVTSIEWPCATVRAIARELGVEGTQQAGTP